jgi:hypothetical protein
MARHRLGSTTAVLLLGWMAALAGGAAWRQSVTIDEVTHIASGVSYLQRLDLRLNEEHPPLPKVLAALPLVLTGKRADYTHVSWKVSETFFPAYLGQWVFGDWFLQRWNDPTSTLALARLPMLLLTLVLGWVVFVQARQLGGDGAGLLCLSVYVSTPLFLVFGPLVHTDAAVTLFTLLTLWTFGDLWQEPSPWRCKRFGLCLAGALLSKFTAGLLLVAFGAAAWSTRIRPLPGQPTTEPEAGAWRQERWRATGKGIAWCAAVVYLVYFVLSLGQSTDALSLVGGDPLLAPIRRLLMPPWLYLRGLLMVLATSSRPTFLLGRIHSHGVWYYFPIVFLLKSAPGFLGLLLLAPAAALARRRLEPNAPPAVPVPRATHWRVLWTGLVAFTAPCFLSEMTISIRHFSVPVVLLILMLAPLPSLLSGWGRPVARTLAIAVALLAGSCLVTIARAFPFFFPYTNALALDRLPYELLSDSNVDWNQALPEVRRFASSRGLTTVSVDIWGFTDPAHTVPGARLWNCQRPEEAQAGQWVVVSANMILDGHNCAWLLQYPRETIAGGSMYAFRLPRPIPPAGSSGGPPPASEFREFLGAPFDVRPVFVDVVERPEKLPRTNEELQTFFTPPKR